MAAHKRQGRIHLPAFVVGSVVLVGLAGAGAQIPRDRDQIWREIHATAQFREAMEAVSHANCAGSLPLNKILRNVCALIGTHITDLRNEQARLCQEGKFTQAKDEDGKIICP
jgi:hypothetical protein